METDKEDQSNNQIGMGTEETLIHFPATYDVQVCSEVESEADLQTHMKNCTKYPNHTGFIPIKRLKVEDFPSGYQDQVLFDFTKVMADLTVRIIVKFISPDRPEFLPGTKNPYPGYNKRGTNSSMTGTGRVISLKLITEGMKDHRTCPCPECEHSDTPRNVWWNVEVLTAKHVVFDESEVTQSRCRLGFDDETSPVVNIFGWKVELSEIERDVSKLCCVTHDIVVGEDLEKKLSQCFELHVEVWAKYRACRDVDKLTIIVSHPHGCSKQVSVGRWVHRKVVGRCTWYMYDNCTCIGSSGARVYRPGSRRAEHPHSGTYSNELNFSAGSEDKWLTLLL